MAKMGRFTRLRSVIRFPSFSKHSRAGTAAISASPTSAAAVPAAGDDDCGIPKNETRSRSVYVGKSRRRYEVSADVFDHPLFQELLVQEAAAAEDDEVEASSTPTPGGSAVVSCEVVLFEHMLWMLENAGPSLGSTDELVKFYTCCD